MKSLGDLTIYPIREIKGNRILYGDEFDDNDSDVENIYFVKNDEFHPDMLIPESDSHSDDDPIYDEIVKAPNLKLSKSFEYIPGNVGFARKAKFAKNSAVRLKEIEKFGPFFSNPSLNSYNSYSSDSGYRSINVALQVGTCFRKKSFKLNFSDPAM